MTNPSFYRGLDTLTRFLGGMPRREPPLSQGVALPGLNRAGRLALGLLAALVVGCAAPAPQSGTRDAELTETLRLAQEARLELQTQTARLSELEAQVRDLSEMLAWSAERDAHQDRTLDSLRGRAGTPLRTQPKSAPAAAPSSVSRLSPDEATAYRDALNLYFGRQYASAISAFKDLLATWPGGSHAANATYWIGESHYGLGDYAAALAAFQSVLSTHPGSSKADDAQLKLGYCHLKLGDTRRAGEEFRKLVSLHPSSEYVERARAELSKLGQP
jgi:tol-pal system protein YbgF